MWSMLPLTTTTRRSVCLHSAGEPPLFADDAVTVKLNWFNFETFALQHEADFTELASPSTLDRAGVVQDLFSKCVGVDI